MRPEKKITDEESQNGITQEFQLFVVARTGAPLVGVRAMRKRLFEKPDAIELISQAELQIRKDFHKKGLADFRNLPSPILLRELYFIYGCTIVRSFVQHWRCTLPCPASTYS